MKKTPFNLRSAYGQLVALVFLPIVILAMVGGVLVFKEVRTASLDKQDALAYSALLNYEMVLTRHFARTEAMSDGALSVPALDEFFHKILPKQVYRMAIFDGDYRLLASHGGYDGDTPFEVGRLLAKDNDFERQKTTYGTSYARAMSFNGVPYYVVVEMDSEPLTITSYRVVLALAITGLITLLLLLLILNIYSKRWIAPIYEMRLFLQKLTTENLDKPIKVNTSGEFSLLQRDFVQAMRRLSASFNELKTHANETEQDLQHALDEMEMQTISIRKARDLAVSSSHAKSAFLANISHELRTPLNSIDGFINLLARHDGRHDGRNGLSAEQSLYVQTIKKSSAHLLALVNDVLDFSKLEADKLVLDSHVFDLYSAIYDVVDMLSPMALEKHLRLSVLFYNDVPNRVTGDSLRVKQILTNLVGNAIKFTDTGGVVVRVGLSDDNDGYLNISVEDTGKGVSDDDKASLFKSFSQGDLSVTRRYGGTGLGLVISKQLTELMGGTIGFYDNNSENIAKTGATFWFEMPVHSGGASVQAPDDADTDDDLYSLTKLAPTKLLVWINHAPAIQVLKATLAGSDVDVHFAIGFADLLEQLDKTGHGFDWVIVDYFGQDASLDDVGAILRQIRSRYQGKLSAYGYQVGMDNTLLDKYQTHALYEPMNKRQLIAMFADDKPMQDTPISKFSGHRVLAVDDHPPNLLVLEALLGELDVAVITAHNGFDAIETMTRAISMGERIDLIFMDIQMPRMSGLEASIQIRKIEESHNRPPIPIIALTAHGLSDEKERLVSAGLSDYVGKPIGHEQLVQTLSRWLGESGRPVLVPTDGTPNFAGTPYGEMSKLTGDDMDDGTGKDTNKGMDKGVDDNGLPPQQSKHAHKADKAKPTLLDIDWADALARSANKDDLAKTLLSLLIESSESEKLALERAWADRDRVALADITHRLVGGSRYTGVPRLRDTAEDFEQKCRANLDDTSAGQFISIRPSYRSLIDALESLENIDIEDFLANGVINSSAPDPTPKSGGHDDEDTLPWKMV
ncbi:response regulator [Moraxella bovis]|uniref:histidine kinase n=1 Tax=Moraxella bovis TaxID=476 RepID=A0AAQ2Q1W6_MORBO|nr:ATP-binding protein [Moraxella bovis]UYZ71324.1 response regulator [Moraxella bovis]UYZ72762.1 response regulator [Moraxella bovis]UYZ76193.1 response regulator [Moraxella bovis]UYZ77853.1 response regulator [Moraxella bovis]UYZ80748.1 response regulator [Moraxella bovis]